MSFVKVQVMERCISGIACVLFSLSIQAQSVTTTKRIDTGADFLLIAPDARSGAMGEVGAATSPDVNSAHWNPAKLAFTPDSCSVALSYSPWLHNLASDMYLAYMSAHYRIDNRNTAGISFRYFTAGDIELREGPDDVPGTFTPNEFAIDGSFARKFGERFSLGSNIRFVYSNLSNGVLLQGQRTDAGTAFAADVSAYYHQPANFWGRDGRIAFGASITNIGNKIGYSGNGEKLFLPTNLRLGTAATLFDGPGEFTFALDLNKLLVPSPPVRDPDGNIIQGSDPDKSVPAAIFGSFADAPGGFSEELKEIAWSVGMEYIYDKQFALRTGYFYENPDKGDRRYLTLGGGVRYRRFNLDFSYLIASQQRSPLANTLRFTFTYNIK